MTERKKVQDILYEVSVKWDVSTADLKGRARLKHLVKPRQEVYYRLQKERELSAAQIGLIMGGRDHTTIFCGIKAHKKRVGISTPSITNA
jgi:chromosomal replication initiator protein